jgi:hypothetical protein
MLESRFIEKGHVQTKVIPQVMQEKKNVVVFNAVLQHEEVKCTNCAVYFHTQAT